MGKEPSWVGWDTEPSGSASPCLKESCRKFSH